FNCHFSLFVDYVCDPFLAQHRDRSIFRLILTDITTMTEAIKEELERVKIAVQNALLEKPRKPKPGKKKDIESNPAKAPNAENGEEPLIVNMFEEGFFKRLHKVGENPQIKSELKEQHLKATGGRIFTRFPPEPNGFLHIGHCKAIVINFGYARYHGGECYLRYDDTNPEAEEEVYFTAILDAIKWLGFEPYKITHSSDNFQKLCDLAEDLINRGKAYVCHCTAEEIKIARGVENGEKGGQRIPCSHRDRPIYESFAEFRAMREGKYRPNEATLRMKQSLEDGNPQMWDLIAYRVLDAPHHRTGDTWKIYPTYDFTHCLCDSLENITHSLCTTEFVQSRVSYEWLCNALEVYKPRQSEYGRLNVAGTIMSKRKIAKLVSEGIVRGWDDPRLFTIVSIRRRGVPPGAILSFINGLGVTNTVTNIAIHRFENSVRKYLEGHTPRLMMIPDPILIIIENLDEDYLEQVTMPYNPKDPTMGERKLPFTKRVYIDRRDFRSEASDDFFRLAPGKTVGLLKVPFPIRATSFTSDPNTGLVTEIRAHYENDGEFKKPKAYIQWVALAPCQGSPIHLDEVRLFHPLFKSDNPSGHPEGFLRDINENSEEILKGALIEVGFNQVRENSPWKTSDVTTKGKEERGAPEAVRFQAMRVAYFCMDKDTVGDKIVLNRIVTLKEDAKKGA
ncbi:putative glutamine--tRNA ligase, partial [Neolecta irregularis DAH-3]